MSHKITLTIDPLDHFPTIPPSDLLSAGGYVTQWIVEAFTFPEPIKHSLENAYGFGTLFEVEGRVLPSGIYKSPYEEDPDLHPLFVISGTRPEQTTSERVYMYPHAIVAIVSETETFITRMD